MISIIVEALYLLVLIKKKQRKHKGAQNEDIKKGFGLLKFETLMLNASIKRFAPMMT